MRVTDPHAGLSKVLRGGTLFGGNVPREFAVPTAPQAGLNNCTASSHTLSPAEKEQAVPAPRRKSTQMSKNFRVLGATVSGA